MVWVGGNRYQLNKKQPSTFGLNKYWNKEYETEYGVLGGANGGDLDPIVNEGITQKHGHETICDHE